jgi:hypothetical protein
LGVKEMDFNRIIYPERAEYLNEGTFRSYKIFLNHWQTLSTKLKSNFEEALLRRVSKTLIVFGEQSSGKTLFANKITQDFIKTSQVSQGTTIDYDEGNIWHQIVSGFGKNVNLIRENTTNSALIQIEDDSNWVNKVKEFCKHNSSRTCLIIADNCERDYFVQGIRGMTDEQFLQIGRTQEMIVASAQRFVALCRTELRGAVIVMFTNDDIFALAFQEEVNKQHKGLVETTQMPMPGAREKETVVRVNTNRLNPFSYWYCLDRAGVPEKKNVFHTILSAKGFKEVFEAVDQAIQKASPTRIGRPPKKCLLTLFVLTNRDDIRGLVDSLELGEVEHNVNENQFIDVVTFKDGWTDLFDVGDQRKASLLKSEWNFRIVVAGNPFTSLLLSKQSPENAKAIIEKSLKYHGPGTQITTLDTYRAEFDGLVTICGRTPYIPLEQFWAAGQPRSSQYEQALREIFPGYNTNSTGFLSYRPDLVIEPYNVCELSLSPNDNDSSINLAIKRKSLVCEFTASKDLTLPSLQTYLNRKLSNYVEILEEQ